MSIEVKVGDIGIGGGNPIRIQSMTNTSTNDIEGTVSQIIELVEEGSELVRISINDEESAVAVPKIVNTLNNKGYNIPIIGDFHYNGHTLLQKFPEMAQIIDKYRINPGNLGKGTNKDSNFDTIIKNAIKYSKPIRIGVNGGSLDQELLNKNIELNSNKEKPNDIEQIYIDTMLESALLSVKRANVLGLSNNNIIISVKMSDFQSVIYAYRKLSKLTNIPLHLGLTEAGSNVKGIVSSSAVLGILLQEGIGDTIRVSITPLPDQPRSLEVKVCKELLQSMGYRFFCPTITSCPGCGRTESSFFQGLAEKINSYIIKNNNKWKEVYKGYEKTKISVMGCLVNGLGEAKNADIGIFVSGIGDDLVFPVYIGGNHFGTYNSSEIYDKFILILEEYFKKKYL